MQDGNAKQQIADRIKNATNILVTVSTNPSVDELSAALGLTLMLNKLDKHATAVFSGQVPPAIEFLDPTKTFEDTVDSLRDFIIALDKEKADRLRYKVEDDVVRIFITPYKTRITEEDLQFTHGDFNVELVLALGVENKEVLDGAIAAHGKILHDATVATINAQNKRSDLGSIDWQDNNASSLCEMLVALGESLKAGLLDEQIATALLTGIVAATNRFSNNQTSPKSMTMAAQLMAAGANQQLIAAKLEEGSEISSSNEDTGDQDDGDAIPDESTELKQEASEKVQASANSPEKKQKQPKKSDGSLGELHIPHRDEDKNFIPERPHEEQVQEEVKPPMVESATIEEHDARNKKVAGEEALDAALAKLGTAPEPPKPEEITSELQAVTTEQATTQNEALLPEEPADSRIGQAKAAGTWRDQEIKTPSLGGALNATADTVEDEARLEEERNRNKTILSHGGKSDEGQPEAEEALPPLPVFETSGGPAPTPPAKAHTETLADIEAEVKSQAASLQQPLTTPQIADAQQSVDSIFSGESTVNSSPSSTLPNVPYEETPLPPPPPLPDFSQLPPLPPAPTDQTVPPTIGTDGLPLPGAAPEQSAPVSTPNDPGQFKIPGQ